MDVNDFESTKKSREIVNEIMKYGVSQNEIILIIKKLSLELEDINIMKKINNAIKQNEETTENIPKLEI